jgi:hypothetical protein
LNNIAPLVLDVNQFKFHFHSDGSVEDWGFKFTASATYPPKSSTANRHDWMLKLNFEIIQALSSTASILLRGPEKKQDLEVQYGHYMENSLVKPELFTYRETNLSSEDRFLHDLITRSEDGLGEKFIKIMKTKVIETLYVLVFIYIICIYESGIGRPWRY